MTVLSKAVTDTCRQRHRDVSGAYTQHAWVRCSIRTSHLALLIKLPTSLVGLACCFLITLMNMLNERVVHKSCRNNSFQRPLFKIDSQMCSRHFGSAVIKKDSRSGWRYCNIITCFLPVTWMFMLWYR